MRSALRGFTLPHLEGLSEKASAVLIGEAAFAEAGVVLSYCAMEREADPHIATDFALRQKKKVALPRCVPGTGLMEFYTLSPDEPLSAQTKEGMWHIREPRQNPLRLFEPETCMDGPVLAVVPGIAFGPGGERLGRGRGYYDRYLARLRSALSANGVALTVAGFCFPFQHGTPFCVQEHDEPVDAVVTACGFSWCRGGKQFMQSSSSTER